MKIIYIIGFLLITYLASYGYVRAQSHIVQIWYYRSNFTTEHRSLFIAYYPAMWLEGHLRNIYYLGGLVWVPADITFTQKRAPLGSEYPALMNNNNCLAY